MDFSTFKGHKEKKNKTINVCYINLQYTMLEIWLCVCGFIKTD